MAKAAGKYYSDVAAGNVFLATTAAAGVALPLATATAATVMLWNTSTTKNAVLMNLNIGYTSGTIAIGQFGLSSFQAGFNIATGAPITAITKATPINALVGSGKSSAMTMANVTATVAATTMLPLWWSGFSNEIATAMPGITLCHTDFDGSIIVTPGQAVVVVGSVAQTGLFSVTLSWAEVDV
jgi:hypothetical protein